VADSRRSFNYIAGNWLTTARSVNVAPMMTTSVRPVGVQLRDWRQRRRLSQLTLALKANVSQRHLSFVESGRTSPSRDMVLHLAEELDVPLRERNQLLLAAGYAPSYSQRSLDDPNLDAARHAMELVLKGHEPYPAVAIDRYWTLVATNASVTPFLTDVDSSLLAPPANALRLTLHPAGLAPRIVNFAEWRAHLIDRVRHQLDLTGDEKLAALLDEISAYPAPKRPPRIEPVGARALASFIIPMQLETDGGVLSLLSTTTVFGTPVDVTLSELALECFYPADSTTAERLRAIAAA
jgi:transcriptional regulator with XRE-family HTH domain